MANCSAETLAAYSGATVRELHPLPFSLAERRKYLALTVADASKWERPGQFYEGEIA